MICMSCGRANEQGAQFCKSCGAQLSQSDNSQQGMNNSASDSDVAFKQNNGYQQYDMSENVYVGTTRMTKKEFDKCESIKPITKNLMVAAIITYVIGIISFVVNVIVAGNIWYIRCSYSCRTWIRNPARKKPGMCCCTWCVFIV